MKDILMTPGEWRVFDSVARNMINTGTIQIYGSDGERHLGRRGQSNKPRGEDMSLRGRLSDGKLKEYEGATEYISLSSNDHWYRPTRQIQKPVEEPHENRVLRALGMTTTVLKAEWVSGDPVMQTDERQDSLTGMVVPFSTMRYSFSSASRGRGGRFSGLIKPQGAFAMEGGIPTREGRHMLEIAMAKPIAVRALAETVKATVLEGDKIGGTYPTRYHAAPKDWPLIIARRDFNQSDFTMTAQPIGDIAPSPVPLNWPS